MLRYRHKKALRLRITQSIHGTLINPNPESTDGIKALHMHLSRPQIFQVAQELTDVLLNDPGIRLSLRRLPD